MGTDLGFYDLVQRRKMCRSFSDEPVDPEAVRRILDAARRAPTAGNSQGVEFVVVTDAETRRRIAAPSERVMKTSGHHNFVAQAPVHVVVCASAEIYKARYRESDKQRVVSKVDEDALWHIPYWWSDAGAAKMLVLLGAVAEGLDAAFVGVLPGQQEPLRELLGMPDAYAALGVVLLGHAADDAGDFGDVSARPRKRRPYDEVVHTDRW